MKKYQIKKYSDSDQPSVASLVTKVLQEYGYQYNKKLDKDLDDPTEHYLKTGGMFWVIPNDNTIIGTVALKKKGAQGELKGYT
ncbi:MAG: hypothetical protein COT81_04210 [Candidatus Buchananbacteria bacterium CG10_big_fil_rev_8_21_14_0_10_42_9]|uniref:GNAT family N-acetyltransferase n=1 Tax=Candidatus Buchananbacteria bacterium CG10_big_fil_rev_8_21_14_0_10_42_9 TaxID=1974526 RepID=A0A2H0W0E5_9BACT|nr:MAG: hypothetical protein COT81_04210 [Candidatus Buchananbacteria bacterium CG10_big_fil_rev_8_21_14_0_10_42_9]